MRIFLIGFMTAGKTTLGRQVAALLDWPFVDLDQRLEEREGRTIAEIFTADGEEAFRLIERQTLESLTESAADMVVACGGGLPCFFDNMDRLNQLGQTVYLRLEVEDLLQRIRHERTDRPLVRDLTTVELETFVRDLLQQREPYYLKAQFVLQGAQTPQNIIDQLSL
jgi:shikimate kinase